MADLDKYCHRRYSWVMDMTSMNISIPENLREFIELQVREGGYGSASEYVRELVRDAKQRKKQEQELRELLEVGVKELASGKFREFDDETLPELFDEIRSTVKRRLSRKRRGR